MDEVKYIKSRLPEAEILCQLAEEAAELSQAALKLRRAIDGTNPTPVTVEQAKDNLLVEYGDVLNCFKCLGWAPVTYIHTKQLDKLHRWVDRLMAAEAQEEESRK